MGACVSLSRSLCAYDAISLSLSLSLSVCVRVRRSAHVLRVWCVFGVCVCVCVCVWWWGVCARVDQIMQFVCVCAHACMCTCEARVCRYLDQLMQFAALNVSMFFRQTLVSSHGYPLVEVQQHQGPMRSPDVRQSHEDLLPLPDYWVG